LLFCSTMHTGSSVDMEYPGDLLYFQKCGVAYRALQQQAAQNNNVSHNTILFSLWLNWFLTSVIDFLFIITAKMLTFLHNFNMQKNSTQHIQYTTYFWIWLQYYSSYRLKCLPLCTVPFFSHIKWKKIHKFCMHYTKNVLHKIYKIHFPKYWMVFRKQYPIVFHYENTKYPFLL